MSSTRRAPPVDVFQDPPTPFDDGYPFDTGIEERLQSALQPSPVDTANQNIILEPSSHGSNSKSPRKHLSPQSSPQPNMLCHELFETAQFPPPALPNFVTDSPVKKQSTSLSTYFQPIAQKPQKALFTTFPTSKGHSEGAMPQSDPIYATQRPVLGKHAMSDAGIRESRVTKKVKVEDDEPVHIPEPEDMPLLTDDGTKPPYSYATLIGMAILRAPNRRLTLSQIYKWISDTFSHYRNADAGWMNSIRHNLSLNQAFYKKERPKEDPGKGMYWHIQPGMEKKFLDKNPRRGADVEGPKYIQLQPTESNNVGNVGVKTTSTLPPKATRKTDSSRFPGENELSSDATLPASDPANQDDDQPSQMPPPSRNVRSSPPAENIHSSPPVARHAPAGDTPTHKPRQQSHSHSRSGSRHKRVENFRDSGFYSSIESSAPRGHHAPPSFLVSDPDHDPRIHKRGRAEEELARIRGSSYDPSPTKTKQNLKQPSAQLNLSSPLRFETAFNGFTPLTPGVKLSVPKKSVPTVSPNTYLRRHRESVRELVGTPAHGLLNVLQDDETWSPAFTIPDEANRSLTHSNTLSEDEGQNDSPELINPLQDPTLVETNFDDDLFNTFFAQDSPLKNVKTPAQQRPGLQRATTTIGVGVLADVTENKRNSRLASPIRMLGPGETRRPSPSKLQSLNVYTSKDEDKPLGPTDENDFWAVNLSSDSDEAGMDLTQGFQKIGGAMPTMMEGKENAYPQSRSQDVKTNATANNKTKRPALGRALTNVF